MRIGLKIDSQVLQDKDSVSIIFFKNLRLEFPYGLNLGPILRPIGSRVLYNFLKKSHKIIKSMRFLKPSEKSTMNLNEAQQELKL
jgi:hypothetical protein